MIRNLFQHIFDSLKINDKGFSVRKLLAFIAVWVAAATTIRHSDSANLFLVLSAWLLFALLAMGLVTAQQLAEIRTGQVIKTETETKSETVSKSETTGSQ